MGILLKKKMIIIIIIAISITVGTTAIYFLNRAGVFFDPGNRYPSTNLNYMGVLFENESDINAFNEDLRFYLKGFFPFYSFYKYHKLSF